VAVSSPIWLLLLVGALSGLWQFLAVLAVVLVLNVSTWGTLTLLDRARQDGKKPRKAASPVIPYGYTNGSQNV
jgi:hypothetical protein